MKPEDELDGLLRNHAGLTSVVSDRVYPVIGPEGVKKPFCVYTCSSEPEHTHDGYGGIDRVTGQVVSVGETFEDAKRAADEVTAALRDWATLLRPEQIYEPDSGLYQISQGFELWYEEA